MKAITVKQPWASLIAHGIKDIENRTWACPKKYIGQRVLIHASKSKPTNNWGVLSNHQRNVAANSPLFGTGISELPFGSIIGSVQIVDCVQNHPSVWAEKGVYNWVLANPILFKEPIPAKGKLSFWDYPGIHCEEDICLCQLAVDEKNQVVSFGEYYRCGYCGSKWYK